MKASDIPTKFPIPFADEAGTYIRPIPESSADPVAASLDLGFPPNTFIPVGAGGTPPDGRDMNGILNQISAWSRWQNAGATVGYDNTFATAIGGYPKNTILRATIFGNFWLCNVDDNLTDPDAGGAGWQGFQLGMVLPATGARLSFQSSSALALNPVNGGYLWINGFNYAVPSSLTLAPTGISPNTRLYVYAFMSAGVMTLEASTTGYTFAVNGMPQKAGDATRTLVGLAYALAGPVWVYNASQLFVASYFNRRPKTSLNTLVAITTTTSPTEVELNSSKRAEFICWSDADTLVSQTLYASATTINANATGAVWSDGGVVPGTIVGACVGATPNVTYGNLSSGTVGLRYSDGYHYVSNGGAISGGTGNFQGSSAAQAIVMQ